MGLLSDKTAGMTALEAGRISVLNGATPGGLTTGTEYKIFSKLVKIETQDAPDFVDLTETVRDIVAESAGRSCGAVHLKDPRSRRRRRSRPFRRRT